MFEFLLTVLWWLVGGFDFIEDIINCICIDFELFNSKIIQNNNFVLEDKNDVILNNLFSELRGLISKSQYFNYLKSIEYKYHINLNDVKDMTYDVQEKIKIDLNEVLKEIKELK